VPDAYRYVERSIKYGVLFLVLVFTTFFLFEVTAAAENSSVPISDGRRDALYLLSAAALDLRVYRIRLCVSDRGGGIDNIDHVVLPIFPRRRREDINDRRWPGRSLHVSLHYFYGNRITRF
jgi:hypothetical protein